MLAGSSAPRCTESAPVLWQKLLPSSMLQQRKTTKGAVLVFLVGFELQDWMLYGLHGLENRDEQGLAEAQAGPPFHQPVPIGTQSLRARTYLFTFSAATQSAMTPCFVLFVHRISSFSRHYKLGRHFRKAKAFFFFFCRLLGIDE